MVELSIVIPTWTVYVLTAFFAVEIVFSIVKIGLMRRNLTTTREVSREVGRYGD